MAKLHQLAVQLLEITPLLATPGRFPLQPRRQQLGVAVLFAPAPALRIDRLQSAVRQVLPDRIARQLRSPADLSNRSALSYMPASDHTQYRHVYHSFALLLG